MGLDNVNDFSYPYVIQAWPEAREASVYLKGRATSPGANKLTGMQGAGGDPAASRAQGAVRRYTVSHALKTFAVLTANGLTPSDWVRQIKSLLDELREHLGRQFPFLYTFELGDSRSNLHANLLLPCPPNEVKLTKLWTPGFRPNVQQMGSVDERRKVASYISKEFKWGPAVGRYRYYFRYGTTPEPIKTEARTEAEALRIAEQQIGAPLREVKPFKRSVGRRPLLRLEADIVPK